MTAKTLLATTAVLIAFSGRPQGVLNFNNVYAPTHIGSIDGALAGTGIWAQMLAGASPDILAPVGMPAEHFDRSGVPTGLVFGGAVQVPGIPGFQNAFVQMLAWDGARWGTALSGVPRDQLGMTDVVPVFLADPIFGFPPSAPHFTQSAVVPIPEPSGRALIIMAGVAVVLFRAVRGGLGRLGLDMPTRRTQRPRRLQ